MAATAIDGRRARDLRSELDVSASALVPEWTGASDSGEFGAALYEIAARLAEHTTRRLDATGQRDRLAFYETLNLSGGAARAARVPIAFTLAEKREDRVDVAAAIQATALVEDKSVPFETEEALQITPARIGTIIAADPAADRIELSPAAVHSGKPRLGNSPMHKTASASVAGSRLLQFASVIGLEPNDLLRIGDKAYEVQAIKDDIVTLVDPLEVFVPSNSGINKIEDLEAYDLRNVQEHCVYVGHKDLLKLDAAATIRLSIEPPTLASRLTSMDVSYALWGTKEDEDEPAWHALGVGGANSGSLRLIKSWPGSVEELEINGRKSRWLRVQLNESIGPATPTTQADLIALRVASQPDPTAEDRTVTAAYHNSLPLSLTGSFLPFGPEPQRFDTFAVAAPEAFSKKDAIAWLEIALADAFPTMMAVVNDRPNRAYAIGADGRLHVLTIEHANGKAKIDWQRIEELPRLTSPGDTSNSLALSDVFPIYASFAFTAHDLIVAADRQGQICINLIGGGDNRPLAGQWVRLPAPDGAPSPPWNDFTVIQTGAPGNYHAHVLAADANGIQWWGINRDNLGAMTGWTKLSNPPSAGVDFFGAVKLAPGLAKNWPEGPGANGAAIAAIDAGGTLYRGIIDFAAKSVAWRNSGLSANPQTRPFLIENENGDGHLLAAASRDQQLFALDIPTDLSGAIADYPLPGVKVAARSALMGTRGTDRSEPSDFAIAAWEAGQLAAWVPGQSAIRLEMPASGVDFEAPSGLLMRVGEEPLMVLAGMPETVFARTLPEISTHTVTLHDWVRSADEINAVAVGDMPAELLRVQSTPLADGDGTYFAVDTADSLEGLEFRRCRLGKRHSGTLTSATQFELESGDSTADADFVVIGTRLHEVTNINAGKCDFKLSTSASSGPIDYHWAEAAAPKQATDEQIGTLVDCQISGALRVADIYFDPSAEPTNPPIALQSPSGTHIWLLLKDAWQAAPAALRATLVFENGDIISKAFPRHYENPELSWEYFDGSAWRHLEVQDGTSNLASGGHVQFQVPSDLSGADIAGKTDLWIRARLIGGDYGRAKYVVEINGAAPKTTQTIKVDTSELHPPEIKSIKARFYLARDTKPQFVLARNNRATLDETQAALEGGARFDLFAGIPRHTAIAAGGSDGKPGRAIYVRLSKAPDVDVLNLYVDAFEQDAPAAKLYVEVLTSARWAPLAGFADETAGLLRPGMLRLPLNPKPAKMPLFGETGWWLRLRATDVDWQPRVRGVVPNAAMAVQARSLEQEILGSSTGEPNQTYRLVQAPVLPDSLEIRVRETLSDEEREALVGIDGEFAVTSYLPDITGQWVLWHRKDSFAGLSGDDRVYRLDSTTGEVTFPNGRRGKIPPAGRDNIRAVAYRSGGGSIGNVAADTVKSVRSAIQSLEAATNPVPAIGGADVPDAGASVAAATAQLRHGGHALTPADIESYALASAPDVVKAKWLSGTGRGFAMVVSIRVPGVRNPQISRARREGLAQLLAELGWGVLVPDAIEVSAPTFVRARISATVTVARPEQLSAAEGAAHRAILDLLDPAIGPGGAGAEFGRLVCDSDVQRALRQIKSVDRVDDLKIEYLHAPAGATPPDLLVYGDEEDVQLRMQVESRH